MASRLTERKEIARLYASALLELADGAGQRTTLLDQLDELATMLEEDPELQAGFASPLVDEEERRQLLEQALRGRADDLLVDTLQVMNCKGRLGLVPELAAAAHEVHDEAQGVLSVRVRSARSLEDAQRQRVAAAVERVTGKEVRLIETVDPELIAGLVIYAGDRKLDLSLQRRLREAGKRLAERVSQEMQRGGARFVEESEAGV